tara:strand:+ start:279 stop:767 length:489 start_codon:yes stop_codon:yes gene_type:complete
MARTKVVYREKVINNYIDKKTGDIVDTDIDKKEHRITVKDRQSFVILYATIEGTLRGLNGNDIRVLIYCSLHAQYNTNRICLTKPICTELTEVYGVPYQSVRNSIQKLMKKEILKPLGSATYIVNPDYFWRGNSVQRHDTIKEYVLTIDINKAMKPNKEFEI